ncbi:Smr/MutS family protein [Thiomicrospira sp. ALE5]|uniref:Smr/MutS family protein n=1 Tax=Thiomicrospira sp. ALE5 TaxID=748650 RepID=UPI0008E82A17|nr:Smr/MutS family protein [Thiomicrospira sp. ALE5]SFR50427.1 DNA-nicking endonuclease, Smr domain [Thiomicrospira sp. ALE5]
MSELSKEDKLLLEQAFADVEPLKPKLPKYNNARQTAPKNMKKPTRHLQGNDHAIEPLTDTDGYKVNMLPSGFVSWFHPSLRSQDIKKLRQGNYPCQGELDLHGFTQEQAVPKLLDFLNTKKQSGVRSIRIVHGKGYNSIAGPIIKECVLNILARYPDLLGFCSAQPKHGGTGAVYVLFKKQLTTFND